MTTTSAAASPTTTSTPTPPSARLASLDQFRGYTVIGMLLVNYFGSYKGVCPQIWIHSHDYCSYADTIMPQFLFAVGFSLRLTIGRKLQTQGQSAALDLRILRRLLGLVLISLVVYNVGARAPTWEALKEMGVWNVLYEPLKRSWFQTLMHIAVTSLWLLPVIALGAKIRILWMIGSGLAHVLISYWFNFVWCNTAPNAIDGGPLGFLTWCVPAIIGTLACDMFVDGVAKTGKWRSAMGKAFLGGAALMLFAWTLSCGTRLYDVPPGEKTLDYNSEVHQLESQIAELEKARERDPAVETQIKDLQTQIDTLVNKKLALHPVWPSSEQLAAKRAMSQSWRDYVVEPPFVKPPDEKERKWNYWMMSQRAGTLSYPTFAAGLSLVLFALFYFFCDRLNWQLPLFKTFGTNALVAYILHSMVAEAVKPFFPNDSPYWYAYTGLALFYVINWLVLRSLEKQGIFVRA